MRRFSLLAFSAIAVPMFCSSVQAGTWNAYALDMKGGFGYAVGAETEDEAKATALDTCSGTSCEVIVSVESQCIAFAQSITDEYWYGYAYGETMLGTETIALGYCYDTGHDTCMPAHATCIGADPATDVGTDQPGKSKL